MEEMPIVVKRPPQIPPTLVRAAMGKDPVAHLVEVIGRHPTFAGAAEELGVSEFTLRRWRQRFRVEVA